MKKSFKTTAGGVLQLIAAISIAAFALIDGDPSTTPDADAILTALTALGVGIPGFITGIFARDNSVSSEEAGAK